MENDDQVELSFKRTWDPSQEGKLVPLNIDKRSSLLINVLKHNKLLITAILIVMITNDIMFVGS